MSSHDFDTSGICRRCGARASLAMNTDCIGAQGSDQAVPAPTVGEPPAPAAPTCPRCGAGRADLALLCNPCWSQVPKDLRKRWRRALWNLMQHHPAARAIRTWAAPPAAPTAAPHGGPDAA